jgi:hypothetical protein
MLSIVKLSIVMLSIVMLSIVMLKIVMLSVVAPLASCHISNLLVDLRGRWIQHTRIPDCLAAAVRLKKIFLELL